MNYDTKFTIFYENCDFSRTDDNVGYEGTMIISEFLKNNTTLTSLNLGRDETAEKLEEIVNRLQGIVKDVAIFEYEKVVEAA